MERGERREGRGERVETHSETQELPPFVVEREGERERERDSQIVGFPAVGLIPLLVD